MRLLPDGRWLCKGCEFSTRDPSEMTAHVAKHRPDRVAPKAAA